MGNILDINIQSNEKTEFNKRCDEILITNKTDENKAFNMMLSLLDTFLQTFNINDIDNININIFRIQGKQLFSVIYKLFNHPDIITEFENDIDNKNENNMKEYNGYLTFMNNIKYIVDNIEYVDLHKETETDFSKKCNECVKYLYKMQKDMEETTKELERLNQSLEKLSNTLTSIN